MIPPAYVRRAEGTAEPPRHGRVLLVILDGGHACLVRARAALAAGDFTAFAADVCRTQAALLEAASAVDPATDGDENMYALPCCRTSSRPVSASSTT